MIITASGYQCFLRTMRLKGCNNREVTIIWKQMSNEQKTEQYWLTNRARLIALTIALCSIELNPDRMSAYPVLYVFNYLPGALCFEELTKLNVINDVISSIKRI